MCQIYDFYIKYSSFNQLYISLMSLRYFIEDLPIYGFYKEYIDNNSLGVFRNG